MKNKVCVLGGFNVTDKLHYLHNLVLKISTYEFIFPDLDHIKDLNIYYEVVRNSINECDSIILINDSKSSSIFSIIFGMAYQSNKDMKINTIDNILNFFEALGVKSNETTTKQ
jgi:hypothetical protein